MHKSYIRNHIEPEIKYEQFGGGPSVGGGPGAAPPALPHLKSGPGTRA